MVRESPFKSKEEIAVLLQILRNWLEIHALLNEHTYFYKVHVWKGSWKINVRLDFFCMT